MFVSMHCLDILKEGLRKTYENTHRTPGNRPEIRNGCYKMKVYVVVTTRHARQDEYRIVSMIEVQRVCLKFYGLFQQKGDRGGT
jgi:hypothetical protein